MIHVKPIDVQSKGDIPFLHDILYHAIYVPPDAQPPPRDIIHLPEITRYLVDFGKRVGDIGCVALADDERAGAAWVRLMRGYGYVDDSTPELTIAVLPSFRGRGIGTLLLNGLISQVAPHYGQISLSVTAGNPAQRLYERAGFREVRRDGESIIMLWTKTT
jgi:ribosomal protein S18 acetylase RimI-like enzyme